MHEDYDGRLDKALNDLRQGETAQPVRIRT